MIKELLAQMDVETTHEERIEIDKRVEEKAGCDCDDANKFRGRHFTNKGIEVPKEQTNLGGY